MEWQIFNWRPLLALMFFCFIPPDIYQQQSTLWFHCFVSAALNALPLMHTSMWGYKVKLYLWFDLWSALFVPVT
jgi:hypothetical protein